MAMFQRDQVGLRAVGAIVQVADNCFAKLMYYLNVVDTCVPGLDLPSLYTNHVNYLYLDDDDRHAVVRLAGIVSPEVLENKVFVEVQTGSSILNGTSNEFYEVTKARQILAAHLGVAIFIEGQQVSAAKIMVYQRSWVINNYYQPKREAIAVLQALQKRNSQACVIL